MFSQWVNLELKDIDSWSDCDLIYNAHVSIKLLHCASIMNVHESCSSIWFYLECNQNCIFMCFSHESTWVSFYKVLQHWTHFKLYFVYFDLNTHGVWSLHWSEEMNLTLEAFLSVSELSRGTQETYLHVVEVWERTAGYPALFFLAWSHFVTMLEIVKQ